MTMFVPDPVQRRARFNPDDCLLLDGIPNREVGNTLTHITLERMDGSGLHQTFTHEQVFSFLEGDRLKVEDHHFSPESAALRAANRGLGAIGRSATDLTPYEQARQILKVFAVGEFHDMLAEDPSITRGDKSLDVVIPKIMQAFEDAQKGDDEPPPKGAPQKRGRRKSVVLPTEKFDGKLDPYEPPRPRTMRKWLEHYDMGGMEALAEHGERRGNRTDRFQPEVRKALNEAVDEYLSGTRPSGEDVHNTVKAAVKALNVDRRRAGLPDFCTPSLSAVYRAILKRSTFETLATRRGKERARRQFAAVHEGVTAVHLFDRVEMDEWEVPLITLIAGSTLWEEMSDKERAELTRQRCWVTAAIDCASRYILALSLSLNAPSGATASAGLQMLLADKTALGLEAGNVTAWLGGRPRILATDRGPGFRDRGFRAKCADLRVTHILTPGGHPEMRGTVERFFPTLERYALGYASGRTFNNPQDRGEYKPAEHACLTEHELNRILIRAVERYHHEPHEGLDGETPHHCFQRKAREWGIRPSPGPARLRHIFGIEHKLTIGPRGITFLGLDYQSQDLQTLHHYMRGKVKVKIDPQDLGAISVQTHEKSWICVPCRQDFARGLSLKDWVAAAERLRARHVHDAELARPVVEKAIADIREIADAARIRAGLPSPQLTPKDLERQEREVFRSFRIRDSDATPASDEPLFGTDEPGVTSPSGTDGAGGPAPSAFGNATRWILED
jgi:putative transposase